MVSFWSKFRYNIHRYYNIFFREGEQFDVLKLRHRSNGSVNNWSEAAKWMLTAGAIVAAAFFLGSWIENRTDRMMLEHDAAVIAAVEKSAPETVDAAIAALNAKAQDAAAIARGKALLLEKGYRTDGQNVQARLMITVFMVVVMGLRGVSMALRMRRVYRGVKSMSGERKRFKAQMATVESQDCEMPEDPKVCQVLTELSEQMRLPVSTVLTMAQTLLERKISAEKYEIFCRKLQNGLTKINRYTEAALQLAAEDEAEDGPRTNSVPADAEAPKRSS